MSTVNAAKKRLSTSAMIASIAAEGQPTRSAPFGHALASLAEQRQDIVGLRADLSKYTDLHIFAKAHPERFYQMGMAEQLSMSAAAGMAREGMTPFATTYAVFASRRAYDFICMAIAEENLNVKTVVGLPGLTTGYGPRHQATDDLAIFRAMPDLMIVDPCDALEIEQAVPAIAGAGLHAPVAWQRTFGGGDGGEPFDHRWARGGGRRCVVAQRGDADVPPDRAAGCVPRRRRTADLA